MWREVGLLGRDDLLSRKIAPRLKTKKGFILIGQHGIGKTAILEWCYEHAEGKKAIVSACLSTRDFLKAICLSWGVVVYNNSGEPAVKSSYQIKWMQDALLAESGHWIFVDDVQKMKPQTLEVMKALRDRCIIVCAAVFPLRKDELRRMLWGIPTLDIPPIKSGPMKKLAEAAAIKTMSITPIIDAVHAARGIPAQLFHALRGEITPESLKTKSEEIDISPVILIFFAGIMVLRYVGKGTDSITLTLLGGFGMAGALICRFFLFKGMK